MDCIYITRASCQGLQTDRLRNSGRKLPKNAYALNEFVYIRIMQSNVALPVGFIVHSLGEITPNIALTTNEGLFYTSVV